MHRKQQTTRSTKAAASKTQTATRTKHRPKKAPNANRNRRKLCFVLQNHLGKGGKAPPFHPLPPAQIIPTHFVQITAIPTRGIISFPRSFHSTVRNYITPIDMATMGGKAAVKNAHKSSNSERMLEGKNVPKGDKERRYGQQGSRSRSFLAARTVIVLQ